MGKGFRAALLVALALAAASCSSGGDSTAAPKGGCEEVLGEAGVGWVGQKSGRELTAEESAGPVDLKGARVDYYEQLKAYDPDEEHSGTELCSIRRYESGKERAFTVEFGPSSTGFDFKVDGVGGEKTANLNADVRLHQRKTVNGVEQYGVYVRCKIPGTPPRQLDRTPLAGVMTDTLTGDSSARTHMKQLLYAARTMVRALDCDNKPVVPADPPSSVL
ncbi:hypothetical protein ACFVDQ_16325 [Streptomyces sp. NPDC057684]|uniref:hypothetical protein n=1 Tax=unclassified Streptomyces TaxID=2593676 RepID=UPI0036C46220